MTCRPESHKIQLPKVFGGVAIPSKLILPSNIPLVEQGNGCSPFGVSISICRAGNLARSRLLAGSGRLENGGILEYASSRTGGDDPDPARSLPPALTVPDDNDRESADQRQFN